MSIQPHNPANDPHILAAAHVPTIHYPFIADLSDLPTSGHESVIERKIVNILAAMTHLPITRHRPSWLGRFAPDGYIMQFNLFVEVDGPHHNKPSARENDARKDALIREHAARNLRIPVADRVSSLNPQRLHDYLLKVVQANVPDLALWITSQPPPSESTLESCCAVGRASEDQFLHFCDALGKFDLTALEPFRGWTAKTRAFCPVPGHGEFVVQPNLLVNSGKGCPRCGLERTSAASKEQFRDYIASRPEAKIRIVDDAYFPVVSAECDTHGVYRTTSETVRAAVSHRIPACPTCRVNEEIRLLEETYTGLVFAPDGYGTHGRLFSVRCVANPNHLYRKCEERYFQGYLRRLKGRTVTSHCPQCNGFRHHKRSQQDDGLPVLRAKYPAGIILRHLDRKHNVVSCGQDHHPFLTPLIRGELVADCPFCPRRRKRRFRRGDVLERLYECAKRAGLSPDQRSRILFSPNKEQYSGRDLLRTKCGFRGHAFFEATMNDLQEQLTKGRCCWCATCWRKTHPRVNPKMTRERASTALKMRNQGRSCRDIARRLSVNIQTVKSYFHRLRKLRARDVTPDPA